MTFRTTIYSESLMQDVNLVVDRYSEPDPEANSPAQYDIMTATTEDGRNVSLPWQECTDEDLDKAWNEAVRADLDARADRDMRERRDG